LEDADDLIVEGDRFLRVQLCTRQEGQQRDADS